MSKDKLVELGFSTRPHGIKGAFLFKLFNENESVLAKNSEITLFPKDESSSINSSGEKFKIENIHFGNKTICYLAGIKDRNQVEQMLPFKIFYPRDKFPKLSEDEIYVNDLLNLSVINSAGVVVGTVESQYDNGAQTILKIKVDGKFVELPFVENFFPSVDLDKGTITYIAPEYEE